MKEITAPNSIESAKLSPYPSVFLSGGVSEKKLGWRSKVIDIIRDNNINCTILNPKRRYEFDFNKEMKSQIKWEYEAAEQANIFSIWLCKSKSSKPISLFELGRYITLKDEYCKLNNIVIGIDPKYIKKDEIKYRLELLNISLLENISYNLETHAKNIIKTIKNYRR